jgi:hypothetical protein
MTDKNAITQLKDALRGTTAPRLGKFGERIYKHLMIEKGHAIQGVHQRRIDFKVDGVGFVDVKTSGLGKKRSQVAKRQEGVNYCFVSLKETQIDIEHEDWARNTIMHPLSLNWEQATNYWYGDNIRLENEKSALTTKIKLQTKELKNWIEREWRLKAAVVYREGRSTQESMTSGKKPWGPVTFYESPDAKRKIDIKVLMYFDQGEVWRVMAYPIKLRDEIIWYQGRTNSSQFAFDPWSIDGKFIFSTVDELKIDFLDRFWK